MNETIALFWMVVIITLRLGLPLFLVLVCGNMLNAWLERQSDQAHIS